MSRQTLIEFPDALYQVLGRGVARLAVFLDDRDREEFLLRTGRHVHRGDLIVMAFCLMPNHVHILCRTPRASPGRWMQLLMGGYALRHHTSLCGTEIARRYARAPAAVCVATHAVENHPRQSPALAHQLNLLDGRLSR